MQIITNTIAGRIVVFESIIDEIPGGVSLLVENLDNLVKNANVDKRFLPPGTPVYVDIAARTAEVSKSSTAITGSGAQAIRVAKNNHWKVDDILNDGITGANIDSITTSNASYDILNVDAALVYAEGTEYCQGSATGASTALEYTPNGLTKNQVWMGDGNADAAVVTVGSVRDDALTFPLNALLAAALRGDQSTITIV